MFAVLAPASNQPVNYKDGPIKLATQSLRAVSLLAHSQGFSMLKIYSLNPPSPQVWQPGGETISTPTWIDLINPSDEEREHAAGLLGAKLPARAETSAIELSSRFSSANSLLRLNIPFFVSSYGTK